MNRSLGHVEVTGPSGTTVKDTFTCCHCNGIAPVPPPNATEMGYCSRCHARECIRCAKRLGGRCIPFEKKLRRYEQRQKLLAAAAAG